jgi:2-dehydro-3-deoxyglucarate aldolase
MNPFRQLLQAADMSPPLGTWLSSASPLVAEAVGHAGFDWGVLDMEHSPLDLMGVVQLLQALASTRLVPVVRVPWNDAVVVKRVLDAGAETLMIPFVQNAEQAARAVAATRYPPEGVRGMAGMTRADGFGSRPDHFTTANGRIAVILQLETPQALAALDSIAAVPGVDALFIGPADLSGAMGLTGQTTHPDVLAAIAAAVRRSLELGMPIGTIGGTPEQVAIYRAVGFSFLAVNSDIGLLVRSAREVLAALRGRDALPQSAGGDAGEHAMP